MTIALQPTLENDQIVLKPLKESDFDTKVNFHIGATDIRSQIAISRLGAFKVGRHEVTYFGETAKLNFVYALSKTRWQQHIS